MRAQPVEFAGIRKRYLPEGVAHTKAQHHMSEYALRAAADRQQMSVAEICERIARSHGVELARIDGTLGAASERLAANSAAKPRNTRQHEPSPHGSCTRRTQAEQHEPT